MVIRRASVEDAAMVSRVLREAFHEYRFLYSREGYNVTAPDPEGIRARMAQGPVWLALSGGDALGTVSAVPRATGLYVRGMGVRPSARGRRIGELLLREVERFAAAHGYPRLFLSTAPFLSSAIRLYCRFGFTLLPAGSEELHGTPLLAMQKRTDAQRGRTVPRRGRARRGRRAKT